MAPSIFIWCGETIFYSSQAFCLLVTWGLENITVFERQRFYIRDRCILSCFHKTTCAVVRILVHNLCWHFKALSKGWRSGHYLYQYIVLLIGCWSSVSFQTFQLGPVDRKVLKNPDPNPSKNFDGWRTTETYRPSCPTNKKASKTNNSWIKCRHHQDSSLSLFSSSPWPWPHPSWLTVVIVTTTDMLLVVMWTTMLRHWVKAVEVASGCAPIFCIVTGLVHRTVVHSLTVKHQRRLWLRMELVVWREDWKSRRLYLPLYTRRRKWSKSSRNRWASSNDFCVAMCFVSTFRLMSIELQHKVSIE